MGTACSGRTNTRSAPLLLKLRRARLHRAVLHMVLTTEICCHRWRTVHDDGGIHNCARRGLCSISSHYRSSVGRGRHQAAPGYLLRVRLMMMVALRGLQLHAALRSDHLRRLG